MSVWLFISWSLCLEVLTDISVVLEDLCIFHTALVIIQEVLNFPLSTPPINRHKASAQCAKVLNSNHAPTVHNLKFYMHSIWVIAETLLISRLYGMSVDIYFHIKTNIHLQHHFEVLNFAKASRDCRCICLIPLWKE